MSKSKFIIAILPASIAAVLLLGSLRLPLWHMRMEAPQYRGREALKVLVFPGALRGNLSEIRILNQYIGVTIPDTLPQTHWLPTVLGVAALLGVLSALLPAWLRRFAAPGVGVMLALAMLAAAAQAQVQMYRIGHDRNPRAPLVGVGAFTPPLLGSRKVAQFDLDSRLGLGSLAIAGAIALYTVIGFMARRRKDSRPAERSEGAPSLSPAADAQTLRADRAALQSQIANHKSEITV
jgi:hypothetical protein